MDKANVLHTQTLSAQQAPWYRQRHPRILAHQGWTTLTPPVCLQHRCTAMYATPPGPTSTNGMSICHRAFIDGHRRTYLPSCTIAPAVHAGTTTSVLGSFILDSMTPPLWLHILSIARLGGVEAHIRPCRLNPTCFAEFRLRKSHVPSVRFSSLVWHRSSHTLREMIILL